MDVERKSLGAHVHLMEAMSSLYLVTGDPIVRERLVQLIVINSNAVVRKRVGACTDEHQQDWTPLRGDEHDRVCSGHDVKNVWLLIRACEAAGLPNWPLLDLYRTLFQSALNYGFDQEWGGFYESGPLNAPADRRQKVGWVQAEALLSALHMYRLAGDRLYLTCFTRTLDWVTSRQVDWRRGDWYSRVLESGNPAVGGASMALGGPYHQARAMIECLDLLPTPAEPEAGVDGAD
jgi:mannose/cellobiose epimerase-like protein (N-acyl-D-glucosamine 2-epimerase family)